MTPETPPRKTKKFLILGGLTLLFGLTGVGLFLYWHQVLRFEESTDDAYVNGNQIVVTSQIHGFIETLYADETDLVAEGTLLAKLDSTNQRLACEQAQHLLAEELRQVVTLFETVKQLQAEWHICTIETAKAYQDYKHRQSLLEEGAVTMEQYEHAEAAYQTSRQATAAMQHRLRAALAAVENTTPETHPRVEMAKDKVRQTFLDWQRCRILAPATGMIGKRLAQVGESIKPGTPLMLLFPLDHLWVEANFKETQLKNLRIGQPVVATADFYGRSALFHGKVIGLAPATGSLFAVLPPQNATGNWIKIVQRLPVRIYLDPQELVQNPLRLGLSMNVTVDTHHVQGEAFPPPVAADALFHTAIYAQQLQGAEELIESIIRANTSTSSLEDTKRVP